MMNQWLIFLVGSGLVFFVGAALVLLSMFVARANSWISRAQLLVFIVGCVLIAISGTPLPWWVYGLLAVTGLIWQVTLTMQSDGNFFERHATKISLACSAVIIAVAVWESQFHFLPDLSQRHDSILVLADSITAGTGSNDETNKWPDQLAAELNIEIDNRAIPGAKCATALKQTRLQPVTSSLAVLEIGGNDLLGTTSAEKYEADLKQLLTEVCINDIEVVMFELPLPPFRNRFGMIQRRLARQFDCKLLPKWFLLNILTQDDSTIDSVHLTRAGHDRFASAMQQFIETHTLGSPDS